MIEAPWPYPDLESGLPLVENTPTRAGAALGREIARLADVAEARLISEQRPIPTRCIDCAARLGTLPNQCESTLFMTTDRGTLKDEALRRALLEWAAR